MVKHIFWRFIFSICPFLSQVYIVAVQRSTQKEGVGRSADLSVSSLASDGSASGSEGMDLLKLVQSDLLTLSRLWLVALQDYSLLTLPQEYASQLPATGRRGTGHLCLCWYSFLQQTLKIAWIMALLIAVLINRLIDQQFLILFLLQGVLSTQQRRWTKQELITPLPGLLSCTPPPSGSTVQVRTSSLLLHPQHLNDCGLTHYSFDLAYETSIHLSIFHHLSGSGSQRQHPKQYSPDAPLPGQVL